MAIGGEEVIARLLMVLTGLSTEEVLQKISEAGIEVTGVEMKGDKMDFQANDTYSDDNLYVTARH